jgi:colanic acid biosynthesis glycosyl transferase WcaI
VQIIMVNRYFYPDHSASSQMVSDLAFGLAKAGHAITVITSQQRYDDADAQLPIKETVNGVTVQRLRTSRFGRQKLALRAVDYLTFYILAALTVWKVARRDDIVVAKTDPPMLSVVLGPVARARGARLVNWLQDLFPEVAQVLGLGRGTVSRTAIRFLSALRDASLSRAARNVAIGEAMAERLKGRGVPADRIRIIPNWADGASVKPVPANRNPLRRAWQSDKAFVVGYSGNLGRAHEMETVVNAIALIEERVSKSGRATVAAANAGSGASLTAGEGIPLIRWLFVGGGSQMEALQQTVNERGLTSALFRPYQPREVLAQSLSVADVHLISLLPDLEGLIVPSKYYGIAAAGRPAIFIGAKDGEIARVLEHSDTGMTVSPGDSVALADAVLSLALNPGLAAAKGVRARTLFERRFDRHHALAEWQAVIGEIATDGTKAAEETPPSRGTHSDRDAQTKQINAHGRLPQHHSTYASPNT